MKRHSLPNLNSGENADDEEDPSSNNDNKEKQQHKGERPQPVQRSASLQSPHKRMPRGTMVPTAVLLSILSSKTTEEDKASNSASSSSSSSSFSPSPAVPPISPLPLSSACPTTPPYSPELERPSSSPTYSTSSSPTASASSYSPSSSPSSPSLLKHRRSSSSSSFVPSSANPPLNNNELLHMLSSSAAVDMASLSKTMAGSLSHRAPRLTRFNGAGGQSGVVGGTFMYRGGETMVSVSPTITSVASGSPVTTGSMRSVTPRSVRGDTIAPAFTARDFLKMGSGEKDQRMHGVREILVTEENYLKDLQYCISNYVKPLKKVGAMGDQEVANIFGNMEQLVELHSFILSEMTARIESKHEAALTLNDICLVITDIFNSVTSDLVGLYSVYCNNYHLSRETLRRAIETNQLLSSFLKEQDAQGGERADQLKAYLIKPVQRICKYPLLLHAVFKHTDENTEGYAELKHTLASLEKVANVVERRKDFHLRQQTISALASIILGFPEGIEKEGRTFYKLGPLLKYNKVMKAQMRYFFLFNDIIIYTKKKAGKRGGSLSSSSTTVTTSSSTPSSPSVGSSSAATASSSASSSSSSSSASGGRSRRMRSKNSLNNNSNNNVDSGGKDVSTTALLATAGVDLSTRFQVKGTIPVACCILCDDPASFGPEASQLKNPELTFKLTRTDEKRWYYLSCETNKELRDWVTLLKRLTPQPPQKQEQPKAPTTPKQSQKQQQTQEQKEQQDNNKVTNGGAEKEKLEERPAAVTTGAVLMDSGGIVTRSDGLASSE